MTQIKLLDTIQPQQVLLVFLDSNGVFSTIAYPQASETVASGINNNGEIVGTYDGASGFIYINGSYTTIMPPPGSFSFQVNGVNNEGQIVGSYQGSGGQLGFVLTASGYTTLSDPLATNGTYATGINDAEEVVGYYIDEGRTFGFIYNNGIYTTINSPPGGAFANNPIKWCE